MTTVSQRIERLLAVLYEAQPAAETLARILRLIDAARADWPGERRPVRPLDQRDAILITYGDQITTAGERPLSTLRRVLNEHASELFSCVHVLPFYPFTSDDGFAVVDFERVDPRLGSWADIESLAGERGLMVDLVLNHLSSSSTWFQECRRGDPHRRDYFVRVPPGADLSAVFRPRTLPLVTSFDGERGEELFWTTFSADQVDLDYGNPDVLVDVLRILLAYAAHGARLVRLDAVAYVWKQLGTRCVHLPQTHAVVRLMRAVLDAVCPWVLLVTETNFPHAENVSYFGDGDEADLVYQFALPPLVLDAFHRGDAGILARWAAQLTGPGRFFTFLASHDGIGLVPARGLLSDEQVQGLVDLTTARGGRVSYKSSAQGPVPYELNISYFDALCADDGDDSVQRFICAHAAMLALAGVPGIYAHSWLATRNDHDGLRRTGANRSIHRKKLDGRELEQQLRDPASLPARVSARLAAYLQARGRCAAFHPEGGQRIIDAGPSLLCLLRTDPAGGEAVLCVNNVTPRRQLFDAWEQLPAQFAGPLVDIVAGASMPRSAGGQGGLEVPPHAALWLRGRA